MDLKTVDAGDYYSEMLQQKINWTLTNWRIRGDPDILLRTLFYSKSGINDAGFNDPRFDSLLNQASATYNRDARKGLYDRIERLLVDDAVNVWLFYRPYYAVMRKTVQGYTWIPDSVPRFRYVAIAR